VNGSNDTRHPKGKGAWYFTYIRECPVCGAGGAERERRYTPKPDDPNERLEYNGMAYDNCLEGW
jgi:hypothetical protein